MMVMGPSVGGDACAGMDGGDGGDGGDDGDKKKDADDKRDNKKEPDPVEEEEDEEEEFVPDLRLCFYLHLFFLKDFPLLRRAVKN